MNVCELRNVVCLYDCTMLVCVTNALPKTKQKMRSQDFCKNNREKILERLTKDGVDDVDGGDGGDDDGGQSAVQRTIVIG